MATLDEMVTPLALELLECLDQEIDKVPNPPKYVQLRAGTVVDHLISEHEDECCAGLAWVRVSNFFPSSDAFPTQDEVPSALGVASWAIQFEIGAIRCAPTPGANAIPTAQQQADTFFAVQNDAAAMRRALCCFIGLAERRGKNVLAGTWEPLSVQGGCVGGVMTVTVRAPACDCSEAGPVPS